MRRILLFISGVVLLLLQACSSQPAIEKLAMHRLPKAVEASLKRELSLSGQAEIVAPQTVYVCDSLCIIHCEAVTQDASGHEIRLPVRYVFLRDVFMSAVSGTPYYAELVSGAPYLDKKEIGLLKRSCAEDGAKIYITYTGIANPVRKEDL